MHSDPSATYSGAKIGAGVSRSPCASDVASSTSLGTENFARRQLQPDQPFGITVIVGGTNIRACVSLPGATKPLKFSLTWQQLHDNLKPELDSQGIEFGLAHDLVLSAFVKEFFNDLKQECCNVRMDTPPFDKLAALNFSVAGIVRGEGIAATVSTTNTGLHFTNEELAKRTISAMQTELQRRTWPAFPLGNVAILNDAAAGCKGEVLRGGLKGCTNGLFVILGTGIGSMGWSNHTFDFRFDELGHRIVKESLSEEAQRPTTVVNLFRMIQGKEYEDQVASDGSFLPFKGHQKRYAENLLAGPWLAVRFLKKELAEDEALLHVLAEKIAPQLRKNADEVYDNLQDLLDLSSKDLTRWAVNSNSRLVRAVNDFILKFDAWEFAFTCPCTGSFEAAPTHDRRLANFGFKTWKTYWKDVGHFLAVAYAAMKEQGVAPEKIILGGGIGEAYNLFPAALREAALREIQDHSGLTEGLVNFSDISAEERESAITQAAVDRAAEELASKRSLSSSNLH